MIYCPLKETMFILKICRYSFKDNIVWRDSYLEELKKLFTTFEFSTSESHFATFSERAFKSSGLFKIV